MQKTHTPVLSLKEKQRLEREELIVRAAEEVLLARGYYETSMDEIARRVGIAKGTIYAHFPGKEELVLAILARDTQRLLLEIDALTATEASARARLEALMRFSSSGSFARQTRFLTTIYSGVDLKRAVRAKGGMDDVCRRLAGRVTELLEEGKAAGEFDTALLTAAMQHAFFSIIAPGLYAGGWPADDPADASLLADVQRIYFNGITRPRSA